MIWGWTASTFTTLDAATAKLTPHDPPEWKSQPGTGPRALRFHPNGKWAYCVLELSSEVAALRWDPQAGSLTTVQTVSLIPEGYAGKNPHGSEIVLDRAGTFVYAADRFRRCAGELQGGSGDGQAYEAGVEQVWRARRRGTLRSIRRAVDAGGEPGLGHIFRW